jgi:hypothetical protein
MAPTFQEAASFLEDEVVFWRLFSELMGKAVRERRRISQ